MPPWYNPAWGFRKKLTIAGAAIVGTANNVQMFVSEVIDADLAANALANGDDILFTAADGTTKLPHDKAFYSVAGTLSAWVQVGTLTNPTSQDIYMYFGNPASGPQENKLTTWNPNYLSVWHMNENGGAGMIDALAKQNIIFINPGSAHNGTGLLSAALPSQSYNGTVNHDQMAAPTATPMPLANTARTLMCWLQPLTVGAVFRWAVAYGTAAVNQMWGIGRSGTNLVFAAFGSDISIVGALAAGVKHHAAFTHDTTNARGYIDGALGIGPTAKAYNTVSSTGWAGTRPGVVEFWDGLISNIRVAGTDLGASFIGTCYNSESSPGTFYTKGALEPFVPGGLPGGVFWGAYDTGDI